jgi:hypothetical protein
MKSSMRMLLLSLSLLLWLDLVMAQEKEIEKEIYFGVPIAAPSSLSVLFLCEPNPLGHTSGQAVRNRCCN